MTDHNELRDSSLDYPLADSLEITEPDQYKALFEPTRQEIVSLLLERAATTAELAETLGKPKGTIGHHLKTLERTGLVTVVRTKQVRALTAKYYGRTARVFYYQRTNDAATEPGRTAQLIADETSQVAADTELPASLALRHARIPEDRAEEWIQRLHALIAEFSAQTRGGATTYAFVAGIYPTSRQPLASEEHPRESGTK
ncbi:ArsR/SmtB family transcription factor [Nesterenkonia ebinurensis]|uniref:ArsR/SmtB family transcription factor n=1 Tax=Nesterenkonia ebinurensis TaxID=2608252 RepID=UPI00123D1502|nr:winged helix-turn-helix domain-containing protein [Nesterenkonia ebinurensis]